ncbi:hypothetical protein [Natronococcus pandeyae]|nr:hypothetical protein [Natronococcus pandeyae]
MPASAGPDYILLIGGRVLRIAAWNESLPDTSLVTARPIETGLVARRTLDCRDRGTDVERFTARPHSSDRLVDSRNRVPEQLMAGLTRRKLLCGLSLSAGVGVLSVAARESRLFASDSESAFTPIADEGGFDPAVNGFGFDNYSTPPVPPEPTDFVSESDVREALTAYWSDRFQNQMTIALGGGLESQIGPIAERLYTNANRLFGTKGYCYGMAAAAQWYFEEPAALPVDRDSASEIEHVNDPLEDQSSAPVRNDIERFHRSQFLNVDSWLERWALLRPEWIDYRSQARKLRATIDEFGSAGVTITGENVLRGHYVLLYDYDVTDSGVTFAVYDPNDGAEEYAETDEPPMIGVDTTSDEPLLEWYDGKYDRFLFNPQDRRIRAGARSDRAR